MDTRSPSTPAPPSVGRVVTASFIGTTIEWYDFFLYGTASALVFGELFFPTVSPIYGTMAAFATYSVGFFARPVGGIVFGHFGDRLGRKSMLVTTLMLMGVATFAIGLLPTHATIGFWAPLLLVLLRFIQGFGVGGEWGGAVLMAVEHGHQGRRGLYASWVQAGVPAGLLLANAIFNTTQYLTGSNFMVWGWRIPFLLGIVLLGIGLFIRLHVLESPLFEAARRTTKSNTLPIVEVFVKYPKSVLLSMGARFAENACFYIFTVFVLSYAKSLGVDDSQVLNSVLIASGIQLFLIPFFGVLSDRIGRRPVYLGGTLLLIAFAFPFFWLVETRSTAAITLAVVLGLVIHSAMYAPQAAFFSELFGTSVRYSGASIGYQLAAPLSGGLAPLIAIALLNWNGGDPALVAAYLIIMALITLLSVWLAKETHQISMDH